MLRHALKREEDECQQFMTAHAKKLSYKKCDRVKTGGRDMPKTVTFYSNVSFQKN